MELKYATKDGGVGEGKEEEINWDNLYRYHPRKRELTKNRKKIRSGLNSSLQFRHAGWLLTHCLYFSRVPRSIGQRTSWCLSGILCADSFQSRGQSSASLGKGQVEFEMLLKIASKDTEWQWTLMLHGLGSTCWLWGRESLKPQLSKERWQKVGVPWESWFWKKGDEISFRQETMRIETELGYVTFKMNVK